MPDRPLGDRRWGAAQVPVAPPATRDEFKRALVGLVEGPLQSRRDRAAVRTVEGSTRLFDEGVIDSLAVLELLAFVEAATGRAIPLRMVDMKYFGSIDRICETFWQDPEGGTS